MEIIKGIKELIEKSRKYRQAQIDLDMAEMELNCVNKFSIRIWIAKSV